MRGLSPFIRFRLPGIEHRFSRQPINKACVVHVRSKGRVHFVSEGLDELKELVSSAGIRTVGTVKATLDQPSSRYFLREGKLTEIRHQAQTLGANVIIFSVDLSPGQAGHIGEFMALPILDRTGLILNIFSRRARSSEGKLQVELAGLHYVLPRLVGLGTVMSRTGGGIGTRGPGEQELEHDRRKVRRRNVHKTENKKAVVPS